MDKIKKTIVKLFAVMVVAIATLLCGVLLGCGLKTDDEIGKPIDTSDTIESDNGNGDVDTQNPTDNINPDDVVTTVPPSLPPNGVYLSAKIDEKEEYDIDDISIELLCGIDIDLFNNCGHGAVIKDGNEEKVKNGLSIIAYDNSKYIDVKKPLSGFDYEMLYDDLTALEVGSATDGAFLIEEIPFTIDERVSKRYPEKICQCVSLENFKGTEYDCTKNKDEIVCHKKFNLKFPVELFSKDSGFIYVDMALLTEDCRDEKRVANVFCLSDFGSLVRFEYSKNGDKIVFSYVELGSSCIVDGTLNKIETKTKSLSNAKLIEENREIDNEEIENTTKFTLDNV